MIRATKASLGVLLVTTLGLGFSPLHPYPPARSMDNYRVLNRKYVSHFVFEQIRGQSCLTLIATHGGPWAFKARSHALHYCCTTSEECYEEAVRLDRFLRSGWNLRLKLDGSFITKIEYLPWPRQG